MEISKRYESVISLGKLLVEHLGIDEPKDIAACWMAHHIAELILDAENASGDAKKLAEDRCREAILSLWQRVQSISGSRRPFVEIEAVLATINAIDPNNEAHFYQRYALAQIEESTLSDNSKSYLELVYNVDFSARLVIWAYLQKIVKEVAEENDELLKLIESADINSPTTLAINLLFHSPEESQAEQKAKHIKRKIEDLKSRREKLLSMIGASESIVSSIDREIKEKEIELAGLATDEK